MNQSKERFKYLDRYQKQGKLDLDVRMSPSLETQLYEKNMAQKKCENGFKLEQA